MQRAAAVLNKTTLLLSTTSRCPKSYRCISLLNCLGKMVEKVAAMMVGAHCDRIRGFHPGQYGCRKGRSAVDAGGVTIAQVQEAWAWGTSWGPY